MFVSNEGLVEVWAFYVGGNSEFVDSKDIFVEGNGRFVEGNGGFVGFYRG